MDADPMRRGPGRMIALVVVVLAVAACSSDVGESTTTSIVSTTTVADETTTTPATSTTALAVDKTAVVQEYLDRRSDGRVVESLELATTEISEEKSFRQQGLAAWNFRSEPAEPCTESSPGRFLCPMHEYTDFHIVAGLSPWTNMMVVEVNDEGIITAAHNNLTEWSRIQDFNQEFQTWLESAHPDEAAQMNGAVMNRSFTETDAVIALRHVEEYVASQSEG
jgi:hypothetical protein